FLYLCYLDQDVISVACPIFVINFHHKTAILRVMPSLCCQSGVIIMEEFTSPAVVTLAHYWRP
ncbi:hypothetical protein, partial [Photobacterium ganghwense]|uniref:hypothetical protein n=1 Tax=Photobacterium ganghwense TaxID=320778 RepID=UPI001C2D3AD3